MATIKSGFDVKDEFLYCENVCIKHLTGYLEKDKNIQTPYFVYSENVIKDNINQYKSALENASLKHMLGFSIKANFNVSILKLFAKEGCIGIAVSGHEIELALKAGIRPDR